MRLSSESLLPGRQTESAPALHGWNSSHRCVRRNAPVEESDERCGSGSRNRAQLSGFAGAVAIRWASGRRRRGNTGGAEGDAERIAERHAIDERLAILAKIQEDRGPYAPLASTELHRVIQHGDGGWRR